VNTEHGSGERMDLESYLPVSITTEDCFPPRVMLIEYAVSVLLKSRADVALGARASKFGRAAPERVGSSI
jgi:hypothetical protein